jgi:hypothetical protein
LLGFGKFSKTAIVVLFVERADGFFFISFKFLHKKHAIAEKFLLVVFPILEFEGLGGLLGSAELGFGLFGFEVEDKLHHFFLVVQPSTGMGVRGLYDCIRFLHFDAGLTGH